MNVGGPEAHLSKRWLIGKLDIEKGALNTNTCEVCAMRRAILMIERPTTWTLNCTRHLSPEDSGYRALQRYYSNLSITY